MGCWEVQGRFFYFKFSAYTLASWYASGWRWFAVSAPSWICSAGRQQALLKLPFFVSISGLLPGVKSFPYFCHLEEEQTVNVTVSLADPRSSYRYTGSIQQHLVIIIFCPVLNKHCFSCSSEWGITFTDRFQSVLVAFSVRCLRVENDSVELSKLQHTTACHRSSEIFFSVLFPPSVSVHWIVSKKQQ